MTSFLRIRSDRCVVGRGLAGSSARLPDARNEGREIRTPNLLIWSQTRCRCAIPPMSLFARRLPLSVSGDVFATRRALALMRGREAASPTPRPPASSVCSTERSFSRCSHGAHGVVVSHPLRMRKALGSIPSVSICICLSSSRSLLTLALAALTCAHSSHINKTMSTYMPHRARLRCDTCQNIAERGFDPRTFGL